MSEPESEAEPPAEAGDGRDPTGTRRRPLDITSLVAGIVVLALSAAVGFGGIDALDDQVRLVWPLVLGAVGIGLLAGIRRR